MFSSISIQHCSLLLPIKSQCPFTAAFVQPDCNQASSMSSSNNLLKSDFSVCRASHTVKIVINSYYIGLSKTFWFTEIFKGIISRKRSPLVCMVYTVAYCESKWSPIPYKTNFHLYQHRNSTLQDTWGRITV